MDKILTIASSYNNKKLPIFKGFYRYYDNILIYLYTIF